MKKVKIEPNLVVLDLVQEIKNKYPHLSVTINQNNNIIVIPVGDSEITIDLTNKKYSVLNLRKPGRANILDLQDKENYSVVMLLVKLLDKGYSIQNIDLEKKFKVGHKPGYLDVCLTSPSTKTIYMVEVKSNTQIEKYVSCTSPEDTKQAISYAFQDKNTKIVSYYTYDFDSHEDDFYSIWVDNDYTNSRNVDDFYDIWNQEFNRDDFIKNNGVFDVKSDCKKYNGLKEINIDDTKKIFTKFQNILRVYSVSDKPNAFMKFINLLLCKVNDEVTEDKAFAVKGVDGNTYTYKGLKCQYIDNIDTPETFNSRLNELYQSGMSKYLNKEVIGYSEADIRELLRIGSFDKIIKAVNDLSLKCENPFTFIEVYNNDTFEENSKILRDMVKTIEGYKFKYDYKQQFLGDFFEELLNTSLKQEAGQFFTPMPMVDFVIDSLPYKEDIVRKLVVDRLDIESAIPCVIDYACGSGHFLTSSMSKTQKVINEIAVDKSLDLSTKQKNYIESYADSNRQYHWVMENNVVGVEKDYRLAKTTKITTYLNGDGRATILNADGVDVFNSLDYSPCQILFERNPQKKTDCPSISIDRFDYVISNPPYSVKGFIKNLIKNGIEIGDGNFSLYTDKYTEKDTKIENLFVERAWQLLKPNGIASLILPQSVLTSDKYIDVREFIYKYFEIKGMVLTSDISFSGTTTSPVILFMRKRAIPNAQIIPDNEVVVITSPKYKNPKSKSNKEKEFLGYEFSSNRNNSGITLLSNPIMSALSTYIKEGLLGNPIIIDKKHSDYVSVISLSKIILGSEKMIYPKYKEEKGTKVGVVCNINSRVVSDFTTIPNKYLEISDIQKGEVVYTGSKNKSTTRFCRKGDILLSSLCPTSDKIAIADDDYMVSPAIHVLSVNTGYNIDEVLQKLRSSFALEQMNNLLDGFKITYAKISEENLKYNVRI